MIQVFAFTALIFSINVSAQNKVIYGPDNRHEIYESNNRSIQELSESVVALVEQNRLIKQGTEYKLSSPLLRDNNICPHESFSYQPNASFCSGFLIAHNKILTAGHCIETAADCRNVKFVFDYKMKDRFTVQSSFAKEQVYGCKKIVVRELSFQNDYAVVELDRYVEDRYPLRISNNKDLKTNDEIFVIGHPAGLPAKIADKAYIRSGYEKGDSTFKTNLDTYGGNSGSPVFNAKTLEVEGILIRGEEDFVETYSGCKVSNNIGDDDGNGETVNVIRSMALPGIKDEILSFENNQPILHVIWSEVDQTCNMYRNGVLLYENTNPAACRRGIRYQWSDTDMSCNLFNGLHFITSVKADHCFGTNNIRNHWEEKTRTCKMFWDDDSFVIPSYNCHRPSFPGIKYIWYPDNTCNEVHGDKWIREIPNHFCGRPKNSPVNFRHRDNACKKFYNDQFVAEVEDVYCTKRIFPID